MNYAYLIDYALFALAIATAFLILETALRARTLSDRSALGRLTLLAVVAKSAPFVGLAGTIVHIMAALGSLSAGADIAAVGAPIALALKSTLLGLASAIPAVIAHDLLIARFTLLGTLNSEAKA